MNKIVRDNQRLIVYGFIITSFAVLIGFLLLELLFKPEIWENHLWIPTLGFGLAFLGMVVECNRLEFKLSQINQSSTEYKT